MRGVLAAGCLLLLLGWPAVPTPRPLRLFAPPDQARRPVALVWVHGATRLAFLEESTLRLSRLKSAPLGLVGAWAFAPGGERVVIAAHANDDPYSRDTLRIVALRSLRTGPRSPRLAGWVSALAWLRSDRIVAVVGPCCSSSSEVDSIDARTRTIVSRVRLTGRVATVARTANALVLLVVPENGIASARLAVVDAVGAVRVVALPGFSAGWSIPQDTSGDPVGDQQIPGLAVDPVGDRAYVIEPDGSAADVDLQSLAVSYHRLRAASSVEGRLAAWLQPAAAAKGMNGPFRTARWIGGGLVALTGYDERLTVSPTGEASLEDKPAGVAVVDAGDWTIRTLDAGANAVTIGDGILLATGSVWSSDDAKNVGIGVVGYGTDRSRRFGLFPGAPVWVDFVLAGRAYVDEGRTDIQRTAVVDLASGKVVAERSGRLPVPLVADGPDD